MGVLYLSGDALDDLITAAQFDPADNTPAMEAIVRRFEGAALAIARSITGDWYLQQDAAQGARLGLIKAVRAHTPGTPGFAAYAWRYMKGGALRVVTTTTTYQEIAADPLNASWAERIATDVATDTTFEFTDLIAVLKPKQQAIIHAYYITDLRLEDIAERLGVSKPAVSQQLRTIYRALRPVVQEAMAA